MDFQDMEANKNEISKYTATMLLHMKEYFWKSCRKGLIKRGLDSGIMIGSFKRLENEFMNRILEKGYDELMTEFKQKKLNEMNLELQLLDRQLYGLNITIGNIRKDVASKFEKDLVAKWSIRMKASSNRFMKTFSNNNDLSYTAYKKYEETMRDTMYELNFISRSDSYKGNTIAMKAMKGIIAQNEIELIFGNEDNILSIFEDEGNIPKDNTTADVSQNLKEKLSGISVFESTKDVFQDSTKLKSEDLNQNHSVRPSTIANINSPCSVHKENTIIIESAVKKENKISKVKNNPNVPISKNDLHLSPLMNRPWSAVIRLQEFRKYLEDDDKNGENNIEICDRLTEVKQKIKRIEENEKLKLRIDRKHKKICTGTEKSEKYERKSLSSMENLKVPCDPENTDLQGCIEIDKIGEIDLEGFSEFLKNI